MSNSRDSTRGRRALAALGFDPNSVLAKEPGVLLDRHFLTAMHAELEAELGPKDAATTLTQIGLIQGMHDAWRIIGESVLPSRPQTRRTEANSPSNTSRRLSFTPSSVTTSS